jgi:chromate reductase, NAD(P)H dehydrogenase (quinone)
MTQESTPLQLLGLVGSIRRGSYNRMLMAAAREVAPAHVHIDDFAIGRLPLYDADHDNDEHRPDAVVQLKRAVADADGLLIATPEYNHTVPGVLQNAIDWASRPAMRSPLRDKPVAIMGASTSAIGTARAQQQLKLTLLSTLAVVFPHAGVLVPRAKDKFDATRGLHHEETRGFLQSFLDEYARWLAHRGGAAPAGV